MKDVGFGADTPLGAAKTLTTLQPRSRPVSMEDTGLPRGLPVPLLAGSITAAPKNRSERGQLVKNAFLEAIYEISRAMNSVRPAKKVRKASQRDLKPLDTVCLKGSSVQGRVLRKKAADGSHVLQWSDGDVSNHPSSHLELVEAEGEKKNPLVVSTHITSGAGKNVDIGDTGL